MDTTDIAGPGTIIAERYRIVRPLASGGFGSVFEAVDTRLNNAPCAIKVIHPEGKGQADALQRFQDEMRHLSRLRHDGIPRVIDFFTDDSWLIVMDFVDGANLESEVEAHLGEIKDAAWHRRMVTDMLQVLDVLAYLHRQDPPVVHRDIKPANLIRERVGGRIKVVDFGLARAAESMTRSAAGTLAYCPIEQLQGRSDARSDIYAMGATLFHLLSGRPPTPLSPENVRSVNDGVAPELAAIVSKAMAVEAADRFQTAGDMARALEEWLKGDSPPPAQPSRRVAPRARPRAWMPWVAVIPAVGISIALCFGAHAPTLAANMGDPAHFMAPGEAAHWAFIGSHAPLFRTGLEFKRNVAASQITFIIASVQAPCDAAIQFGQAGISIRATDGGGTELAVMQSTGPPSLPTPVKTYPLPPLPVLVKLELSDPQSVTLSMATVHDPHSSKQLKGTVADDKIQLDFHQRADHCMFITARELTGHCFIQDLTSRP